MLFREEHRSDINLCNFVTANLPSVPKDDDWLILNLRGYGYYRVNYDARNWNLILMELNTYHTNIDVLNRARIIDDLFDLAEHLRRIHYAWACKYKYAPCVIEARHAFNFFRRSGPRSKSLLVDHQVTVFCTVIEDGGESEWQALYNLLSHASSPTERSNIIVSLGCSKNPSTLRRYSVTDLFTEHGASLDAHKVALERIKESANRNVHWMMNHYAEVSRWLKRDVTEFILDDQVMRGNITNNATIGGGNVSDVFFEESDFTNVTRN
ncbi:conserved hypothetical protein [Ixodes scapularis]|uniref:ERAP1-like C-terminal domain-containing protein n=1 Tax=Ixodes scapularis TaxID=6945 RepID=B7Q2B4_IXOSC|nr:conserved hypothetical protein [Ixodes scapularis]|eukprot:XP_002410652.1 conserved hypothetical protein [Ixodes scapularis]